jgi:hypothetical protein
MVKVRHSEGVAIHTDPKSCARYCREAAREALTGGRTGEVLSGESNVVRGVDAGLIRRECVDHIIVLGEAHLRRILKSYARYYNETRTHLALDKDEPVSRPVQRIGVVRSLAILGGLHHHYARA